MFWWHSLECAVLSGTIALRMGYNQQEEAFLAGLLHDIGKLFLWANSPEVYANIYEITREQPELEVTGEMLLGGSHSAIGADLLYRWNLHNFIVDAVRYHHEPKGKIKVALPLVKIVHVANNLCRMTGDTYETGLELARELFGFQTTETEAFAAQCKKKVEEVARSLGVALASRDGKYTDNLTVEDKDQIRYLSLEVQDYALLAGTLRNLVKAKTRDNVLTAIYQGLKAIFNVGQVIYFEFDAQSGNLIGKITDADHQLTIADDLIVPVDVSQSLIVRSMQQGKMLDSFQQEPAADIAVLDHQIIAYLGREGVLCLPVTTSDRIYGVFAIALNRADLEFLAPQHRLLSMFTELSINLFETISDEPPQTSPKKVEPAAESTTAISSQVRHEINNPLSIIKNYLKVLAQKLSDENIAIDEIDIINEEIDRVSSIINLLPSAVEPDSGQNKQIDINALLSDLAKIMEESLRRHSNIMLKLELDPSLPNMECDKNAFKQIVINIVKNGIEAMPRGGNLLIRSQYRPNNNGNGLINPAGAQRGVVRVDIRDEGVGIPDEIKHRLFKTTVSTKGENHAGLGLSIAKNLLQKMDGHIEFKRRNTVGTTVTIDMPVR